MKKYSLAWLAHWSEKHKPEKDVVVTYHQQSDGWWEHEYHYYFTAENDKQAITETMKFIRKSAEDIDIYSVTDLENDKVIMTEEDY